MLIAGQATVMLRHGPVTRPVPAGLDIRTSASGAADVEASTRR